MSRYYEGLASEVLLSCYTVNKDLARQLLVRKLTSWGNSTAFSLAGSAQLMVVVP